MDIKARIGKKDIQPVGYTFSALTSWKEIEVDLV